MTTAAADERTAAPRTTADAAGMAPPGFLVGTVHGIRDIVGQRGLLVLLVRRELKAQYSLAPGLMGALGVCRVSWSRIASS